MVAITGMAAGFTVLFGAPLGSALFALEILHRRGMEYYEALLPSLVGALVGYGVAAPHRASGLEPVWHFPPVGRCTRRLRLGDRRRGDRRDGGRDRSPWLTLGLRRVVAADPAVVPPGARWPGHRARRAGRALRADQR